MRELLRKRYYCDHCNRSGGSKKHMEKRWAEENEASMDRRVQSY